MTLTECGGLVTTPAAENGGGTVLGRRCFSTVPPALSPAGADQLPDEDAEAVAVLALGAANVNLGA